MNTERRFDLIVFDWDGTLYDSTGLIVQCIQAACRDLGAAVPSDAQAAYVIGLGLQDALRHAAPELPRERYPELAQRYRHHYFAQQDALVLFPGVVEMLRALKQRSHLLAVATGKARRGLDLALSHAQLHGMFDATRTADETASKPDPRMLLELMREFGVEPERTLMIGDTTHDLQMAKNARTAGLAVGFGAHPVEVLVAESPLACVRTPGELAGWLLANA